MKLFVKAKPGAHEERVEQIDATHFMIAVCEPPARGLANRAISVALAKHFGVAITRISLKSGFSSRSKVFEIV